MSGGVECKWGVVCEWGVECKWGCNCSLQYINQGLINKNSHRNRDPCDF